MLNIVYYLNTFSIYKSKMFGGVTNESLTIGV